MYSSRVPSRNLEREKLEEVERRRRRREGVGEYTLQRRLKFAAGQ